MISLEEDMVAVVVCELGLVLWRFEMCIKMLE